MVTIILWGRIESWENHMSLLFPLRAQRIAAHSNVARGAWFPVCMQPLMNVR